MGSGGEMLRGWSPFSVGGRLVDDVGEQTGEVVAVGAFAEPGGEGFELGCGDVAEAVGDLFGAGDFEALALFDGLDEDRGFEE